MIDILSHEFNSLKPSAQAAAIENLEIKTRDDPDKCSLAQFDILVQCLSAKHPSVKREAARTIANVANLFPQAIVTCLPPLLDNATRTGTVVRWSAAMALVAAAKSLKGFDHKTHADLINNIVELNRLEIKPSIQKIYQQALQ